LIKTIKKIVFASNHPLGGFDGVCLLGVIHHFFGNVKAIVNELLLNIDGLKPVLTGVNVFVNSTKIKFVKLTNSMLANQIFLYSLLEKFLERKKV
jgi:hypothetical protein